MKTILERKGSIRVLATLCCIALIVSFLPVQPAYAYTVKELGDQPYVEEAEEVIPPLPESARAAATKNTPNCSMPPAIPDA